MYFCGSLKSRITTFVWVMEKKDMRRILKNWLSSLDIWRALLFVCWSAVASYCVSVSASQPHVCMLPSVWISVPFRSPQSTGWSPGALQQLLTRFLVYMARH